MTRLDAICTVLMCLLAAGVVIGIYATRPLIGRTVTHDGRSARVTSVVSTKYPQLYVIEYESGGTALVSEMEVETR